MSQSCATDDENRTGCSSLVPFHFRLVTLFKENLMRMRTPLLILCTIAATLLLLALPVSAQDAQGDPERGAELFAENCAPCHGQRGEGRIGATLNDVFAAIDQNALIEQVVRNGVSGSFMPAFAQESGGPLADQEIADIIAYMDSWDTASEPVAPAPPRPEQEIPPIPEVDGDPNNGYTIFQQNCAVCHGKGGEGRIGANLTTAFSSIEPGAYAKVTIERGIEGTLMPAWAQKAGGPLTDEEINDVAAYVLSIQHEAIPPTPEVVGRASALPLIIVGAAAVVLTVALGIAVQRRESRR